MQPNAPLRGSVLRADGAGGWGVLSFLVRCTKRLIFAGVFTAVRTWTFPDRSDTVAGLGATQTWTGANTFADIITVGTRAALAPSSFGYGAAWKCLLLGSPGTDHASNAVTICIGVDPSTNTGSSFSGNGSEILLRRNVILLQPNSGNTDWENASLTLGLTTIYGATIGTPTAGQVLIGNGRAAVYDAFYVGADKVVGARGAAVADATGAGDVVAQLNALLARCRAHGLIAT
jgi:hypothetical protein